LKSTIGALIYLVILCAQACSSRNAEETSVIVIETISSVPSSDAHKSIELEVDGKLADFIIDSGALWIHIQEQFVRSEFVFSDKVSDYNDVGRIGRGVVQDLNFVFGETEKIESNLQRSDLMKVDSVYENGVEGILTPLSIAKLGCLLIDYSSDRLYLQKFASPKDECAIEFPIHLDSKLHLNDNFTLQISMPNGEIGTAFIDTGAPTGLFPTRTQPSYAKDVGPARLNTLDGSYSANMSGPVLFAIENEQVKLSWAAFADIEKLPLGADCVLGMDFIGEQSAIYIDGEGEVYLLK